MNDNSNQYASSHLQSSIGGNGFLPVERAVVAAETPDVSDAIANLQKKLAKDGVFGGDSSGSSSGSSSSSSSSSSIRAAASIAGKTETADTIASLQKQLMESGALTADQSASSSTSSSSEQTTPPVSTQTSEPKKKRGFGSVVKAFFKSPLVYLLLIDVLIGYLIPRVAIGLGVAMTMIYFSYKATRAKKKSGYIAYFAFLMVLAIGLGVSTFCVDQTMRFILDATLGLLLLCEFLTGLLMPLAAGSTPAGLFAAWGTVISLAAICRQLLRFFTGSGWQIIFGIVASAIAVIAYVRNSRDFGIKDSNRELGIWFSGAFLAFAFCGVFRFFGIAPYFLLILSAVLVVITLYAWLLMDMSGNGKACAWIALFGTVVSLGGSVFVSMLIGELMGTLWRGILVTALWVVYCLVMALFLLVKSDDRLPVICHQIAAIFLLLVIAAGGYFGARDFIVITVAAIMAFVNFIAFFAVNEKANPRILNLLVTLGYVALIVLTIKF